MGTLLSADSTINLMDHHSVAAVSLTGISLDVLGGLYLAYDLLGGQHGPLRLRREWSRIRLCSEPGMGWVSACSLQQLRE
jgi:hypothetical protein